MSLGDTVREGNSGCVTVTRLTLPRPRPPEDSAHSQGGSAGEPQSHPACRALPTGLERRSRFPRPAVVQLGSCRVPQDPTARTFQQIPVHPPRSG